MSVLNKPAIKVEIREGSKTEYGTPEPVVRVVFADTNYRAAKAALLHLSAEVEMLSINAGWSVSISEGISILGSRENVHYSVGIVKLSLESGTHDEALRGEVILKKAVAQLTASNWFRLTFQGDVLTEPTWEKARPYSERAAIGRRHQNRSNI